ncbi:MAG: hypothetical protein P1U86_11900 [Verrucomicrobiales bacterium]|nr:hypothetical protein [Verrucomicrobiales bacterium]
MNQDNPFSSGPGKPAPKPAESEPVVASEVPPATPAKESKVTQPVRAPGGARPLASAVEGELPPLEMEETSCRTCQFFHFEGESRVASPEGECRYNAPNPGFDERAQWPIVDWDSWCGQWNSGISNDDMVKMARLVADRMSDQGTFNE